MAGLCGTCTACCRVFAIPEPIKKPIGEWCVHCDIGKGCKIYDSRPSICSDFECLWLQSQSQDPRARMDIGLRPDKSKVVICPTTNPRIIAYITTPGFPLAWREPPVLQLILKTLRGGLAAVCGPTGSMTRTTLHMDKIGRIIEREVRMTEPDKDGMQWNLN